MKKVSFWYEIDEKAGVAYDQKTGADAKAHTHVEISFGRVPTEVEYQILHEQEVVALMAKQTGINAAHFKPISHDVYLGETKDNTGIHGVTKSLSL